MPTLPGGHHRHSPLEPSHLSTLTLTLHTHETLIPSLPRRPLAALRLPSVNLSNRSKGEGWGASESRHFPHQRREGQMEPSTVRGAGLGSPPSCGKPVGDLEVRAPQG